MKPSRKKRKIETAKRVAKELAEQKRLKDSYAKLDPIIKAHISTYNTDNNGIFNFVESTPVELIPNYKLKKEYPEHYILMAAVKDNDTNNVYYFDGSCSHGDIMTRYHLYGLKNFIEGFIDNRYEFHDRQEAGEIAFNAGQCTKYFRDSLTSTGFKRIHVPGFIYHTSDGIEF